MSAKSDLNIRLEYLNNSLALPNLIDIGLGATPHNGIAKLLRKGLGIVAFNILEDFIKKRTQEALLFVSNSGIEFSNLTDTLQKAAIADMLKALNTQIGFLKKDPLNNVNQIIQDECYNIHSTSLRNFSISKYSLVNSGSNVTSEEIADMLKAFGITGGWNKLLNISNSIGGGIADLSSSFQNASRNRHSAAHDASFDYTHLLLSNIKAEILSIAASIDIALTARCRQITRNNRVRIDTTDISDELNFIFLEIQPAAAVVKQRRSIPGRSIKNWVNLQAALNTLSPTLFADKKIIVAHNPAGRIHDWYF